MISLRSSAAVLLAAVGLFLFSACSAGGPQPVREVNKKDKPVSMPGASPMTGQAPKLVRLFDDGSTPVGQIVKWEWNFGEAHEGQGGWHDFTATHGEAWHTYHEAGTYNAQLRVTDGNGKKATAKVALEISGGGNKLPHAAVTADPQSGSAPLDVQLDASASSDTDGSIVKYEWDFDGDGTYDTDSGALPTVQHTSNDAGTYAATVRVTDDNGATDEAEVEIIVDEAAGSTPLTVDSIGDVGRETSMALIDGKPAISYWDATNDALKYAYSSGTTGSGGWTAITVDNTGSMGYHSSLALIDGKPAIAYRDQTNCDLKYAYSSTVDGSSGWTQIAVDTDGSVGWYPSLALVNGKPAISYWDVGQDEGPNDDRGDLKYAYSSTADGSSGWTTITVDADPLKTLGLFTSLAVVNGKPAIAYWDLTPGIVKYAYSSTVDGSGGWTKVVVASGNLGESISLAVVAGKPAISYWEIASNDLMYAYSNTADGSSGWTSIAVDTIGSFGQYNTSLAVIGGFPAISYYAGHLVPDSPGDLKYAVSSVADGSAGWTTMAVDTLGDMGRYSSLIALADGAPAISYYDLTNGDLRYVRLD